MGPLKRAFLLTALLLATLLLTLPRPAASEEISIFVVGPEVIAVGTNYTYSVTVTGGAGDEGGTYNLTAFLQSPVAGLELTGVAPTRAEPEQFESHGNAFTVNVTAPESPQEVDLVVNVTSRMGNNTAEDFGEVRYSIRVVRPIHISAFVSNLSNMTLEGIDVRFIVDGKLVGVTQEDFGAFENKTVRFDWVTRSVQPGGHEAVVEVDLDGDGTADPAKGEVVTARVFYREYEGPHYTTLLVILLIMVSVLVAIFLVRRSLRRK